MTDNVIRAALYARVSTKNQDPEPQLLELRAYALRRGWLLDQTIEYVDSASGIATERAALKRLMTDARHNKLDAVLVWKFDRFARSLQHLVGALDEFRALNIQFVSITEGIDTSRPDGRLIFQIIAAIAEFERCLTRERVAMGLAATRERLKAGPFRRLRNGKEIVIERIGRPKCKFDVKLARRLREQGKAWLEIGQALGVHYNTVRNRLRVKSQQPTEPQLLAATSERKIREEMP